MKTVLITGVSKGIGAEFAKIFAAKKYNLILVARNKLELEEIAEKISEKFKIKTEIFCFDLSEKNSRKKLFDAIKNKNIFVDILINNAGFGKYGNFADSKIETNLEMIELNISAVTELTHIFLKNMLKKNSGKILNIASSAAFQPVPRFSIYASSKSYVLNFSEALHFELKNTGVNVSVLCPPPTKTSFEHTANVGNSKLFSGKLMNPKKVALAGYRGLMKNQMTIIPGIKNKFMAFLSGFSPSRKMRVFIADKIS